MNYRSFASGYLIKDDKVFLIHHKKFNKWTPAGGHIDEGETPDQTLIREWKEELDLDIAVLPAHESAFAGDANATPIPMPFHIDLEREGFDVPHIGYFFYVKLLDENQKINISKDEVNDVRWYSREEIPTLETFDQVRALAIYAMDHYPKI